MVSGQLTKVTFLDLPTYGRVLLDQDVYPPQYEPEDQTSA